MKQKSSPLTIPKLSHLEASDGGNGAAKGRNWQGGCDCLPGQCKEENGRNCADWTKRKQERPK